VASVTYNGTGRRKTSVARVTLTPGAGRVVVNGKELDDYFGRRVLQTIAVMPFEATHTQAKFDVRVNVVGGGMAGQAGAIRHGISRALLLADENLRTPLKRAGFLTRDARVKERKKAGLKKARKRPQFSKR
jgi:small subunit ribosomal protein S9